MRQRDKMHNVAYYDSHIIVTVTMKCTDLMVFGESRFL